MNRGNTKPAKPSFMQRRKLKNKVKKSPAGEDSTPLKKGAKRKDDDVALTSSTDEETLHEHENHFSDDEIIRVEVNDFYYINPPVETAYNPYNCHFNNNHHHHHHNYHNHQFKQHMSWYNQNHDYTTRPHSHFNNYSEWMHNPNMIHQQVNPSEPHSYHGFNAGTHSGFQIFGVQPTQTCTCDHNDNESEQSPDDGQFECYSASPQNTNGNEKIVSQKVLKIEEVTDSDEEDKKVKTKKSKKRYVRTNSKYTVEEPTDDEAPKVDEPSSNSCS